MPWLPQTLWAILHWVLHNSQINLFNCLLIDRTFIGFSPFCLNCSVPSLLFLCVTSQVNYHSKVIVVSGTVVGGGCKSGTDRLMSVNNSWWNYISYWPWAWKPKLMIRDYLLLPTTSYRSITRLIKLDLRTILKNSSLAFSEQQACFSVHLQLASSLLFLALLLSQFSSLSKGHF